VHVYNNLLFRWGVTEGTPNSNTNSEVWRGIEIGGGDRMVQNGKALIEANRFIPASGKTDTDKDIATNVGTEIDLGDDLSDVVSLRPNEFDGVDGRRLTGTGPFPGQPAIPPGSPVRFDVFRRRRCALR
jgi:hypothetical protein